MKVLSLFDGMSCSHIALDRLGINVDEYYASEIDKYALKVSQANYPNIIQLGDILHWQDWDIDWETIDLVIGGFPCQSWSIAGKQLGDKDERGKMFWVMLDIMKKVMDKNPAAYYLMENVRMRKKFEEYITTHTENALPNVNKYCINSALVSAQNRIRFYWTNINNVEQPEDKGIVLKDILENNLKDNLENLPSKTETIKKQYYKSSKANFERSGTFHATGIPQTISSDQEQEVYWRKLLPLECMRLQTVQDDYLMPVSNTQKYKLLGNGFTVDVICHILKKIKDYI